MDDISFSQPLLEDFPWNIPGDSGVEEVIVNGQMVETIVKLEGDFSAIGERPESLLTNSGSLAMKPILMASEVVTGYRKRTVLFFFRPGIDDEDDADAEVPFAVYFGKLP